MDEFLVNNKLNLSFQLASDDNYEVHDYGSTNWDLEDELLREINDTWAVAGDGSAASPGTGYRLSITDILKTMAMVLVMVLAIFGNALVILSVFRSRDSGL